MCTYICIHICISMYRASLVAQTVKNLPAMWRPGFNPWVGKIPWRRAWQLQYSCLENSMDRGPWWATSIGSQRLEHD